MRWFHRMTKVAHGSTFYGELFSQTLDRVSGVVRSLTTEATLGGPRSVLPRWRGEIRRQILLLPPEERLPNMSMVELNALEKRIASIESDMQKYSAKRFREITGAQPCQF